MLDQKTISTPSSRYGSGRAATWGFIAQRITGALGIVFTIFLIWIVVRLARADTERMGELLANPVVALVTALMIISTAIHMWIGMREVIEDYVHDPALNRLSLLANAAFSILIALVTLAALVKLVIWG
ncbi:MAG TPA: succinate dehydrogenase, hydrophobic membrane anchor protein [Devosiaceae bacterium]|jgi:succinate dehydrogenase / fumarate reductase membrane anchor subunit|nr:succinate dehydrogenase, hydrophobic membrane anchor protein [Devosiaceae bacterium]